MSDFISLREFARRKGVAIGAVQHALDSGRIARAGGGKSIDWSTQSIAWEANRDLSKVRDSESKAIRAAQAEEISSGSPGDPVLSNLAKAKLANAAYVAKMRKLAYEREAGKLVEKEQVEAALFRFCRDSRDQILNIPDRVAASVTSNLMELVEASLKSVFSEADARKAADAISSEKVDKIVRREWDKESRQVLENLHDAKALGEFR
jgi:hypothetical protein